MNREQMHDWVELYCLDLLENEDKVQFELELQSNEQLREMLSEQAAFLRLIKHKTSKELVKNQLNLIRKDNKHAIRKITDGMQVHINKYWKTASVAAGVAIIASTLSFFIATKNYDKALLSNKILVKRVNDELKKTNKKLDNLNNKVDETVAIDQPSGDSKQMGTGFALNNNGYILTNAHVVNGYNKIYVFTKDGNAHLSTVVKIDAEKDLALLKINQDDFKFSDKQLGYTILQNESNIAERVYTMGYPKGSIVYNEGYISSKNGKDEDEHFYQLELPSSPGVSGSPVFNTSGNVVGVINSKESIGTSTTYALKSIELSDFMKDLDSVKVNTKANLQALNREQQLKKVEDFIVEVKVY